MSPLVDRTAQRFGRLLVLCGAGRDERGRAMWLCACDCGNECVVRSNSLGQGATRSCGCLRSEEAAQNGKRAASKISGELSPFWKLSDVSYETMHGRVRARRGTASMYECVDCGGHAKHWSYDGLDDNELVGNFDLRYSMDVTHYQPRCVPCHSAYDLTH
jgi:hypothetical protein